MNRITTMTAAAMGFACLALTGCVEGGSYNSYDRGYYQNYDRPYYSYRRDRDWNGGRNGRDRDWNRGNDRGRDWNRDRDSQRSGRTMSRPDNAAAGGPQGRFEMRNGRRIWIPQAR